jgi:signal transduction histidine kinase/HAMP domain-containing protein
MLALSSEDRTGYAQVTEATSGLVVSRAPMEDARGRKASEMMAAKSHKSRTFVSVGVKLAGVTIVVMAVFAVALFMVLSRHERSSVLASKETAARMVVQLFSDSLSAPLLFSDRSDASEVVAKLARNDDVLYAAVWQVDAAVPSRLGPAMVELERGASGIPLPAELRSSPRVQVSSEWILVETGVVDPRGKVLGMAQAVFSLARENDAIRVTQRRVLLLSVGVAIVLSLVLAFLARRIIVQPLARLATAAKSLEVGQPASIELGSNDEIGSLAQALAAMSSAIEDREQRLSARNRDLRLVLDNVGEGFIMIDGAATMNAEHSRVLDEWFGPPPRDASFLSYLATIDEELAALFSLGWDAVVEDVLPLELNVQQLPRSFCHQGRSYTMRYRPILEGAGLASMLVVISDVTERIERERSDRRQRERIAIFQQVMRSRVSFEEFNDDAKALMSAIEATPPEEGVVLRRLIHTLKGNCAQFGVETVASACHAIETRMSETGESVSARDKAMLRELWAEIVEPCIQLARGYGGARIELDVTEYSSFLEAVRARADHRALAAMVASWEHESAARRLDRIADQARAIASRLGRAPLEVECRPTTLRLPPKEWAPFWSVFAHVLRNAVDHGIEPAAEREAAGKPASGRVVLQIEARGSEVLVSIIDDGRGLAWEKIAEKARARNMPAATRAELTEALFADGISSRDEVTTVSGRGVGMGAVRAVVRKLGGRIELHSEPGTGTTVRFWLPRTMLGDIQSGMVPVALSTTS